MLKSTKTKMGSWGPKSTQGGRGRAFGKADGKIHVCKTCGVWFMKKHWVHPADIKKTPGEHEKLAFTVCPACRMKRDHAFEGEVTIRGFAQARKKEILALVRNVGERAFLRDPLDRILEIEDRGSVIRITTSENQLAVRIGRKLNGAFKGKTSVRWSKENEVVRIMWEGSTIP